MSWGRERAKKPEEVKRAELKGRWFEDEMEKWMGQPVALWNWELQGSYFDRFKKEILKE
jgi:hypothetical protein